MAFCAFKIFRDNIWKMTLAGIFHMFRRFFFESFPKHVVCEICSLTLKSMKGLENHKKAKHNDDGTCFFCSECGISKDSTGCPRKNGAMFVDLKGKWQTLHYFFETPCTLGWVNFCKSMIFSHFRVNWMSIKKNSVEISQIDQNPGQEASYKILINYLYFTFELCFYWCNTKFRTFDWFAQSSLL